MHSETVWSAFCHRMHYVTEHDLFCDRIILWQNEIYTVTECILYP